MEIDGSLLVMEGYREIEKLRHLIRSGCNFDIKVSLARLHPILLTLGPLLTQSGHKRYPQIEALQSDPDNTIGGIDPVWVFLQNPFALDIER